MLTAVVLVLAGGVSAALYRSHYGVWPGQTYPSTLKVCGRDFEPQDVESRARINAAGYHLIPFGHSPGFIGTSPLWTFDRVGGQSAQALPGGCYVVMWVEGSAGRYRTYALEGGP